MSASFSGKGPPAAFLLRTNWLRSGPALVPGRIGSQRDHGAKSFCNAIFFGPARRSYSGAMLTRHVFADCTRSFWLISICTSFCASTNVVTETSGPTGLAVPNAGGMPAGSCIGVWMEGSGAGDSCSSFLLSFTRHAGPDVAASNPMPVVVRNSRLVFMMSSGRIVYLQTVDPNDLWLSRAVWWGRPANLRR